MGKEVIVAGKEYYPDLWFVYAMALFTLFEQENPESALQEALLRSPRLYFYRYYVGESLTESPIEQSFWQAGYPRFGEELVPQYQIGSYRVDFAIPSKMIAIELDGHDYHKTKTQRTNDAQRERFLERQGWRVIRFTGTEVYRDIDKCFQELTAFIASLS